jgi:hypothetical protein
MKRQTHLLKLLFAVLTVCGTCSVSAQGYQSYFGDSSTVYHIFVLRTCYDPDPGQLGCGWTPQIHMNRTDTVNINDTIYYINTRDYSGSLHLREDTLTGRLYYRYPDSAERLICDMSMALGDTFTLPEGLYMEEGAVMTVDSISYLNGRKIIHFSPLQVLHGHSAYYPYIADGYYHESFYGLNITFVEGIGPTYGVFGHMSFEKWNLGVMLCVDKDGTQVYMTSPQLGCYQDADAIKEAKLNEMLLYPNPATEELHIELSNDADAGGTLWVIDAVGQVVYRKTALPACETVPVARLSPGLYVVQYQIKNRKFQTKFIKN